MKNSGTRLPYDSLDMLLAFRVSETARARREQFVARLPEHERETGGRRYTLEHAVKEVLAEVAEVAVLVKELESQGNAD